MEVLETTPVDTYMYTVEVDEDVVPTIDPGDEFFNYFNVTKEGQSWKVELTASLEGLPDYNPESTVLGTRFLFVL